MAMSEAQKRANNKYIKENCKNITIKIKKEAAEEIDLYIKKNNIKSRNFFIIQCIKKGIKEGFIPEQEISKE